MNVDNQKEKPSRITILRTSRLAIVSISLGIFSMLIQLLEIINLTSPYLYGETFFVTYSKLETGLIITLIVSAILALILGIIGVFRIKQSENLKGRNLAITGIVCGCEFILLVVFSLMYRQFFAVYM
jgi:hypothetical protein